MPTKSTKKSGGATEHAGYAYVTSNHQRFAMKDVDAEKLYEMSENLYIKGQVDQIRNLVLAGGRPKITVYDAEDNVVEDISRELNIMFAQPDCDIEHIARAGLGDIITWGVSIWNPVWERSQGKLICTDCTRLHPFTFRAAPIKSAGIGRVYGHILNGIYYEPEDKSVHYVQMSASTGQPVELPRDCLFVMQDSASDYPDGNSLLYCIIPIASFQDSAWNTLAQQMFRTGAPIMFITISNPQPSRKLPNGEEYMGDVEYAEKVLENWGKDTPYVLRENMQISTIDVKEGSLAIQAINKAKETIQEYMSPVGMLGRDGTLIAGSSNAALKLINNYIRGWISLLENNIRALPNYYLVHNNYPSDWHAEVTIPVMTIDDQTMNLNTANMLYTSKAGSVNEVRELLGLEGVSADELKEMKAEWDIIGVAEPMQFAMSNYSPNKPSYKKRAEISSRAEAEIDAGTEELLRSALKVLRQTAKANKPYELPRNESAW